MTTYFVTGATGALGSALVPMLLETPGAHVRLLIRAADERSLAERLQKLFVFWRLGQAEDDYRSRVVALRGDASEPRFGLSNIQYEELCRDVTHIVHAAGAVKLNLPIDQARRSAVSSAVEAIGLAKKCRTHGQLEKVEIVSTVGVGGRLGVVPEDWITTPRGFHNTYEQAKAEAEEIARREIDAGLPITVHRPSMVVGDSRFGRIIHFQVFYHLCEFLSGARTAGLSPPLGDAALDIIPVDYVARVMAWSSMRTDTVGRILHECSGLDASVPLTTLRDRVRQTFAASGRRVPPLIQLSGRTFNGLLQLVRPLVGERNRRALNTLPIFLEYLASPVAFENARTCATLQAANRPAVPKVLDYLDTVLDAYIRREQ
jgi:thioester reductase-like protein